MSAPATAPKVVRAARKAAPKTAPADTTPATPAVVTPTPEVTPAVVAPVVADAAATPAAPTTPTVAPKAKKAAGVTCISAARVRNHLDKFGLNKMLTELHDDIDSKLTSYNEATEALASGKVKSKGEANAVVETDVTAEQRAAFEATVASLKDSVPLMQQQSAALSRERIRFSSDAAIQLSIVLDELVLELIEHAMKSVTATGRAIIQVEHLHAAGVEQLSLYPLVHGLKTFQQTRAQLNKKTADDKHAADVAAAVKEAVAKTTADLKKTHGFKTPKKIAAKPEDTPADAAPKAEEPVAEAVVEPVVADEDDSDKNNFSFYVGLACARVKEQHPAYAKVRVSAQIRSYLSDIVIELIHRLSQRMLLTSQNMKIKTVNDVAMFSALASILIDGHAASEKIEFKSVQVTAPEALAAEAAKKDEAKKAGTPFTPTPADQLAQTTVLQAHRTISYPTSAFETLKATVESKFNLHEKLHDEKKASAKASASAQASA